MGGSNAPAPDSSSKSNESSPPTPESSSNNSSDDPSPPPPESSSNSNESSPPPEDDSTSPPPPTKSPPPSNPSPPPPQNPSPPPPKKSSPTPSPPAQSPPPPEESSPPPSNPSPPPSSPPPSPAKKSPPPPSSQGTPPPPEAVTQSPPPPIHGGDEKPAGPAGDSVKSPPGKTFVPPPPALNSDQTTSSPSADGNSADSPPSSGGSSAAVIAGAVIGGVVFIMLLICLWMFCRKKKKTQQYYNQVWSTPSPDRYKQHAINIPPGGLVGMPSPAVPGSGWSGANLPPKPPLGSDGAHSPYTYPNRTPIMQSPAHYSPEMGGLNQNNIPYEDLVAATDGFANANMLGQGGFGFVHKGIMPGGKQVAVKSLKLGSGQGEREFHAEVEIISRVHHRHLVSLVGYCIADEKRLLVYEFVPNNTLEYHLHKSKKPPLDFPTRVRIALGSAKGLAYLHEDCHPRIIHRDIKAANILLDYNFEAQVADFGLARLYNDTNTHVSTRVMGTFGYLAPEYASSGKLTDKSDVFSFGVVLLELITGRRAVDLKDQYMEDSSLVDWARPHLAKALNDGKYDELVDPRLEGNYNVQDMANMVACAAASVRHSSKRRPRMSQIVRTLEGDMSLDGLDGTRTGQSTPNNGDYDTAAYNADLKKFRQIAFGTQLMSGGSLTTTSEYGLNPSSSSNDTSPRDSANLGL